MELLVERLSGCLSPVEDCFLRCLPASCVFSLLSADVLDMALLHGGGRLEGRLPRPSSTTTTTAVIK